MSPREPDKRPNYFELCEVQYQRETELLRGGNDLVIGFFDNLIRLREIAVLNRIWEAS